MSETILAAVIGAAAAIAAALIGVYFPRPAGRQADPATSAVQPREHGHRVTKVGTLGCSGWLAWLVINLLGAVMAGAFAFGVVHATGFSPLAEDEIQDIIEDLAAKYPSASPEAIVDKAMVQSGLKIRFALGQGLSYFSLGVIQWLFIMRFAKRAVYWLLGAAIAGLLIGLLSYQQPMGWDGGQFVVLGLFLPFVLGGPLIIAEMESR